MRLDVEHCTLLLYLPSIGVTTATASVAPASSPASMDPNQLASYNLLVTPRDSSPRNTAFELIFPATGSIEAKDL